jgi:hypothetical protein
VFFVCCCESGKIQIEEGVVLVHRYDDSRRMREEGGNGACTLRKGCSRQQVVLQSKEAFLSYSAQS